MDTQHIAAALLAGPFRWKDDCEPNRLNRTADGTPFVEFRILTTEVRGRCGLETDHQAVAYGPAAIRIATTFAADDFAAVSGELAPFPVQPALDAPQREERAARAGHAAAGKRADP